jgi:hypothetical protein
VVDLPGIPTKQKGRDPVMDIRFHSGRAEPCLSQSGQPAIGTDANPENTWPSRRPDRLDTPDFHTCRPK